MTTYVWETTNQNCWTPGDALKNLLGMGGALMIKYGQTGHLKAINYKQQ